LLTEGFLCGWLTFDSKTPLSSLREEYLLSIMERKLLVESDRMKLSAVSSLVGGNPSRQGVLALTKDLKQHMELALPYMAEKTKIGNSQGKPKANDFAFWREVLAKTRAEVDAADNAVLIPVEPQAID
jgi:hypothetical protein